MTIVITKKGSDPAKVAVQQGNEKWNVTENEIDKLPEKVRTHVGRMLGRMPNQWIGRMPPPGNLKQFDVIPDWGLKIGGTGVEEIESLSPGELKDEIEDHFEDVHGKLDRLLRALEKAHTPKKEASPQKTVEQ